MSLRFSSVGVRALYQAYAYEIPKIQKPKPLARLTRCTKSYPRKWYAEFLYSLGRVRLRVGKIVLS